MAEKERLYLRLEVGLESEMLIKVGETPPPGMHTHRWTVFVRGPNDTPLDSQLISKIVFQLHEDFINPKRSKKKLLTSFFTRRKQNGKNFFA